MRFDCIKTIKPKKRKGLVFTKGESYEISLEVVEKKTIFRGVRLILQAGHVVKGQMVLVPLKSKEFYLNFEDYFKPDFEWEVDKKKFREKLEFEK